eukprot:3246919-Amphidinium_carterae.1
MQRTSITEQRVVDLITERVRSLTPPRAQAQAQASTPRISNSSVPTDNNIIEIRGWGKSTHHETSLAQAEGFLSSLQVDLREQIVQVRVPYIRGQECHLRLAATADRATNREKLEVACKAHFHDSKWVTWPRSPAQKRRAALLFCARDGAAKGVEAHGKDPKEYLELCHRSGRLWSGAKQGAQTELGAWSWTTDKFEQSSATSAHMQIWCWPPVSD